MATLLGDSEVGGRDVQGGARSVGEPSLESVHGPRWYERRAAVVAAVLGILVGLGMLVAGAVLLRDASAVSTQAGEAADDRVALQAEAAEVRGQVAAEDADAAAVQADADALADAVAYVVAAADDVLIASDVATDAQNAMVDVEMASTDLWNAGDTAGARDTARSDGSRTVEEYRAAIGELTSATTQLQQAISTLREALS